MQLSMVLHMRARKCQPGTASIDGVSASTARGGRGYREPRPVGMRPRSYVVWMGLF